MSQTTPHKPPGRVPEPALHTATLAAPATKPGVTARRPPAPAHGGAVLTDLAAVRRAKQKERARVAQAVDWYMDRAEQVCLSVPMIYIYVAHSIAAAVALYQIEARSEAQFLERGDPWVQLDQSSWLYLTKLDEAQWVQARSELRALDLIEERRRFDLDRGEIITQIQFLPDAFSRAKGEVRDDIRRQLKDGTGGTGGAGGTDAGGSVPGYPG